MPNFELSDSQIYAPEQLSPTLAGESDLFQVRFWGVRGLIPTPSGSESWSKTVSNLLSSS